MIMTQDKARKTATRQRMAETGEPYCEARRAAEAEEDLGGADLGGADSGGADLGGADSGGADSGGADSGEAD